MLLYNSGYLFNNFSYISIIFCKKFDDCNDYKICLGTFHSNQLDIAKYISHFAVVKGFLLRLVYNMRLFLLN